MFYRVTGLQVLWHFFFVSLQCFGQTVLLPLGSDPQSIIDAHPAGTTYELQTGMHRGYEIVLKQGDTLQGQDGAVMSGAEHLTGWRYEAPYWVHDGPHSKVVPHYDTLALVSEERARYPHDLFKDDIPLRQVLSLSALTDEQGWYYDYTADKVYLKFDPSENKMELSGLCRFGVRTQATAVTLKNLRFEKYATGHQNPAVEVGQGALVENCVVFGSHSVGIRVTSGSTVRGCRFLWNGNAGFHNGGENSLIEKNEFAYNGWAGFEGGWSRAGIKVSGLRNSTVRSNYAHHNTGPGIWVDVNAHNNVLEKNLSELNTWEGILFELSCNCTFRHNICRWNGLIPRPGLLWGAPFVIQNAKHGDVYENYFEASPDPGARSAGVTMVNQNRTEITGDVCGDNHIVEQNHVHDNVIVVPGGGSQGLQYGTYGWATYADFAAANNIWENNTYYTRSPNAYKFHWYLPGSEPGQFNLVFFGWQQWKNLGQDHGSQSIGKPASFFNPLNAELDALILATTGVTVREIKAPFQDAAPANTDADSDSIPDWWEEKHGLNPALNDSWMDPDGDQISNLVEYLIGTNPRGTDSDYDGMPDNWEIAHGTNPLSADGHFDGDNDGLTAIEEYESSTHPFQANALTGNMARSSLSFWAQPGATQNFGPNGLMTRWYDSREGSVSYLTPINTGPVVSGVSVAGYPALECFPGNFQTPGSLFTHAIGSWSITAVLRPRSINITNLSTAVMGNSVYQVSGFRLTMEEGVLKLFTTQSQNGIFISAYKMLQVNEIAVVSIVYDAVKHEARLYINGQEQGRDQGNIPGNTRPLWLAKINGMTSHPVDFSELLVYSKALTHLERREVEAMLLAKYKNTGLGLLDSDSDGMPNWWELQFNTDTENAQADLDLDGLTNIKESQNKTNPYLADSDGDTILDDVEITQGLNPWMKNDLDFDSDGDGLSLTQELAVGTNWNKADTEGDGMNDGWEVFNNLQPTLDDAQLDYDFDDMTNLEEMIAGSNPTKWLDVDGDKMHDNWEIKNGLIVGVADGEGNPDNDALTNFWEFVFSGNPLVPSEASNPEIIMSPSGERVYRFRYSLAAVAYYQIQIKQSQDLKNWVDVPDLNKTTVMLGSSEAEVTVKTDGLGIEYYRVGVSSR